MECSPVNYTTYIDTDPPSIGKRQAEFVVKQLGGKGKIVQLASYAGQTLTNQVNDALDQVVKANPGITLLDRQNADVSRDKGKTIMEAWLQKYPEIDGVVCWTGEECQGAVEAAKEAGRYDQIKAWAGDDAMGWMTLIKGGLNGIVEPSANYCTIDALQAAIKILHGEQIPQDWRIPPIEVTRDNIDKYYIPNAAPTWYLSVMPKDQIQMWITAATMK